MSGRCVVALAFGIFGAGQAFAQDKLSVGSEPPPAAAQPVVPPVTSAPPQAPPKGLDGLKRSIASVEKDIARIDRNVREMSTDMERGDQVLKKWSGTSEAFLAFSKSAGESITACSMLKQQYKDDQEKGEHEIVLKHLVVQLADCDAVIKNKNAALYQYKNKLDEVSEQIDKVKNMVKKVGEFKDTALKDKLSLEDEKALIDKLSGAEAAEKALRQSSVPTN